MLELSPKTNLLEEEDYRYSLQDVEEPMLFRDIYSYKDGRASPPTGEARCL